MNQFNPTRDDFAALLDSYSAGDVYEGSVVKGKIVAIEKDLAVIDVGLKVEGRVPLKEFGAQAREGQLKVGDTVEVYLDRVENALGEAVISREKARREESWTRLEESFNKGEKVTGVIFNQVKGGFTVDLDGAVAFLPRSQVDIRPVRDVGPLMNVPQPFVILKMDKRRGNIVVSRRTVLEETRAEQRSELVSSLEEGQIVDGVVKNITDYGAFVDLGGIDGLLHITDLAWRRVRHPSEVLNVGDEVTAKILKFDAEKNRVSLGMKQLGDDPWVGIARRYPAGTRLFGKVTNLTDYGSFVEIEQGIEGLVHVSEMDWTNKNVHPSKVVSLGDEVEVMILEIDEERRRISLGMKQCKSNPWDDFAMNHKKGDKVRGAIKSITDFGIFIGLPGGIDGLVHLSDLSWSATGEDAIRNFKKGDEIEALVLGIDVEKERISLGVKQMDGDPYTNFIATHEKNSMVRATVKSVDARGAVLTLDGDNEGYLRASEFSRDRIDDLSQHLRVGDEVEAMIINVDRKTRGINLSIKAKDSAEQHDAMQKLSAESSSSAASGTTNLGALLKAKFNQQG
ncbi:MAG: 30S ribosomal protein S1 [Hyphomicrobiaceae bacterium]|nr:30S ribosomal protein S1 [Hyphomicrobiaceae bacterium]